MKARRSRIETPPGIEARVDAAGMRPLADQPFDPNERRVASYRNQV